MRSRHLRVVLRGVLLRVVGVERDAGIVRGGRGAFSKAVKVSREACWSYEKCEC